MTRTFLLAAALLLSVSASAQRTLLVAADGSGQYRTVQAAFDAVPANNQEPVTIRIRPGIYKEKLRLDSSKRFVALVGEDPLTTVLTWDDHTGRVAPKGDTINTYTSASFFEDASDFSARNLTFDNSAGFAAGQAVAVQVRGDRVQFENCRFTGNQDVLFLSAPNVRHYFRKCYIEGTTDFIFGAATALFNNCHIHSKKNSHVTAASTPAEVPYGFVFVNCRLTADSAVNKVSLGRPWRPASSVAYIHCWMGAHIIPEGWNNWKNPANEATARYAEYRSKGPGARPDARVKWARQLTKEEVRAYTLRNILGDWRPEKN